MATPLAILRTRYGAGPLLIAGALPFLFIHRIYQPVLSAGPLDVDLSDLAVLLIVATGAVTLAQDRARLPVVLRSARAVWIAWGALAALVLATTAWGAVRFPAYPTGTHLTTAFKWIEYMLIAPAVAVVIRRAADLRPAAVVLVAWSCVATIGALLQFVGILDDFYGTPAWRRKPSFLGYHDLAALSGTVLLIGLIVLERGARSRNELRLAVAACVTGGVGVVLGGPIDALIGLYLATAGVVLAMRVRDLRHLALTAAILVTVTAGVLAIRSSAISDGLKFLGIKQGTGGAAREVQSYRQRTMLAYIGGRIFIDHPLLGVGWQGSSDPYAFEPYLADAHRHFDQPPKAFPSRRHHWGVQNAYVQALADMGLLGLPAFLVALLVPVLVAVRRGAGDVRALAIALPLLVLGVWNGYGIVAGLPLDALTWLGVGLAAVAVAAPRSAA